MNSVPAQDEVADDALAGPDVSEKAFNKLGLKMSYTGSRRVVM